MCALTTVYWWWKSLDLSCSYAYACLCRYYYMNIKTESKRIRLVVCVFLFRIVSSLLVIIAQKAAAKKDGFYLDCLQTIVAVLFTSLRSVCVCACVCIQCSPNWISTSVFVMNPKFYIATLTVKCVSCSISMSAYPIIHLYTHIMPVHEHIWARGNHYCSFSFSYRIWHWPWNVLPILMQQFFSFFVHLNMKESFLFDEKNARHHILMGVWAF